MSSDRLALIRRRILCEGNYTSNAEADIQYLLDQLDEATFQLKQIKLKEEVIDELKVKLHIERKALEEVCEFMEFNFMQHTSRCGTYEKPQYWLDKAKKVMNA